MRRVFIAIPIEGASLLQKHVGAVREAFRDFRVRWLAVTEWHLTLWFVGNVIDEQIRDIDLLMKSIVSQHDMFSLQVQKLGVFHSIRNPRIIWAGVEENGLLNQLAADIAEKAGVDVNFVPHITLGRIGKSHGQIWPTEKWEQHCLMNFDVIKVDRFALYESFLSHSGSRYERFSEYVLSGGK